MWQSTDWLASNHTFSPNVADMVFGYQDFWKRTSQSCPGNCLGSGFFYLQLVFEIEIELETADR